MPQAFAFAALLFVVGSAVAADPVDLDRKNKRAAVIVALPGGRPVASLDPLSSLIVHTATLYRMNGRTSLWCRFGLYEGRPRARIAGASEKREKVHKPHAMTVLQASSVFSIS